MSYGPPVLNQLCKIWIAPRVPTSGAADLSNVPCQLYISSSATMRYDGIAPFTATPWSVSTVIKLAVATTPFKRGNCFELPQGSGKYYFTVYCETAYLGFASQYDGWWVFQANSNGSVPRTY